MDKNNLVFVPGWATDPWVWEDTADALGGSRRFVSLPGHGGTLKWDEPTLGPAVREIERQIEGPFGKGIVGVGWSLGAQALIAAAAAKPVFSGLVLVAATPCFVEKEGFPWGQSRALVKRMIMEMRKDPSAAVDRFYGLNFTEEELKGEKARAFIERYRYPGPVNCSTGVPGCFPAFKYDEVTTALESLYTADLRDVLKELDTPVLIIHGGKDTVTPVGAAEYLKARIKRASLSIFEEAGHAPFLTERERFLEAVREFLKDC